jgi:hypothetical protein
MIHGMGTMAPERDGGRVFDRESRRREIALECQREPGTAYGLAQRLGCAEGSISQTVRTLESYGVLVGEQPHGAPGKRYRLEPAWSQALRHAERRASTGILREGSDIVVIDAEHLGALWSLLQRASVRDDIQWMTQLRDSRRGALLYLDAADPHASAAMMKALRSRRVGAERLALGATTRGEDLQALASAVLERHAR